MEPPLESPAEEIARLRRCLNDLVGVMALPALWPGREPTGIAGTLLDALLEMLGLDFVYARLEDADGGPAAELMRAGAPPEGIATARELGETLDRALGAAAPGWRPDARVSIAGAEVRVASARLGLQGELGVIAAGCRRPGFPGQAERLLLEVAANQAAVGVQQARLLGGQVRLARALDGRVAERTRALAEANEKLRDEVAERRRAEEALSAGERRWRLIVDNIPGLVGLLDAAGGVEIVNRQLLEYFGKTLD
ncbi:MAG TPA: hypothetical protein VFR81_22685, partial [Longimicrobium sp.]|nr:hypothetical protein [Longimicrobium sp.]